MIMICMRSVLTYIIIIILRTCMSAQQPFRGHSNFDAVMQCFDMVATSTQATPAHHTVDSVGVFNVCTPDDLFVISASAGTVVL